MYCPKCGMKNLENDKFCRSCGLDLSTIARAMEKHLPYWMLEKIDASLANEKRSKPYQFILSGLLWVSITAFAFYCWNSGYPYDAFVFFVMSAGSGISLLWSYLIYVRERSKTKMVKTTADYLNSDNSLLIGRNENENYQKAFGVINTAEIEVIPASVTEATMNLLVARQHNSQDSLKNKHLNFPTGD